MLGERIFLLQLIESTLVLAACSKKEPSVPAVVRDLGSAVGEVDHEEVEVLDGGFAVVDHPVEALVKEIGGDVVGYR